MKVESPERNKDSKNKWYNNAWLKRIGLAGFLFFFIKGLIWLAVFFGLFKWLGE
jgi:DMSO reductase anchor subunit